MAEISEAVLDRMAEQYALGLTRIQIAAEAAAMDAWFAHDSLDPEDDEDWALTFFAILASVQLAVSGLNAVYYQAQRDYLGVAPRVPIPDVTEAFRKEFDEFAISAPVRARFLSSEGSSGPDALAGAATRVSKLTTVSTRNMERLAFEQMMDRLVDESVYEFEDDRPDELFFPANNAEADAIAARVGDQYRMSKKGQGKLRWKRVPQARACGYCQAQGTRLLTDATRQKDSGWHRYCRCSWRKVTASESRAWEPISGAEFKRLSSVRATDETGDGE